MKVDLAEQVVDLVRRLPPEPRRRLRQAFKELTAENGDIKRLEGPLEDYPRLRVGGYRVIFTYAGRGTIRCIFAEQRSVVYELLVETLKARLLDRDRR